MKSVQNGVALLLIDPNGMQKIFDALNCYSYNIAKDKRFCKKVAYDFNIVSL